MAGYMDKNIDKLNLSGCVTNERRHEKTCFLHMRKQRRRPAVRDQRLCFHYIDSTNPQLPKSEISSLRLSSVAVKLGLCRTWSDPKDRFSRGEPQI